MRVVPESTIAANVPREETALPLTAVVALTFQSADESWSAFRNRKDENKLAELTRLGGEGSVGGGTRDVAGRDHRTEIEGSSGGSELERELGRSDLSLRDQLQ